MPAFPAIRAAAVAACLVVLATIAFSIYGHVFAEGLCCGDDASITVAAKNLAEGRGYTTTIPFFEPRGESPFDPALSTGPTLVVPAAALIRLVGPTVWAPGFTTATMCLGLLVALWAVLRRCHGNVRALGFVTATAALQFLFTPGPVFIQWAILLGEIPAALLVIVGLAVLSREPLRPRAVAVAAVLFGLAVLAKILAVLLVMPAAVWFVVDLVRRDRPAGERRRLALAAAAGAVPIVAFELWKVLSLGLSGYRQLLRDFVEFFDASSSGTAPEGSGLAAVLDRLDGNVTILRETYGVGLVVLVLAAVATTVLLVLRRRDDRPATVQAARLSCLLLAGGGAMLAYYLFVSNGIYRYALMGVLLLAAALPCVLLGTPVLAAQRVAAAGAVGILVLMADTGIDPIRFAVQDGFEPTPRLRSLEATGDFLDENRGDHQLVRGWWATAADIEYVLDGTGDYVAVTGLTEDERATEPILAVNGIFTRFAPQGELDAFAGGLRADVRRRAVPRQPLPARRRCPGPRATIGVASRR